MTIFLILFFPLIMISLEVIFQCVTKGKREKLADRDGDGGVWIAKTRGLSCLVSAD